MRPSSNSLLLRGIGTLVTADPAAGEGPLGLIHDAAVLCRDARIDYVGPESGLPVSSVEEPLTLDLDGCVVLPGLIDCHTHLVYAGNRLGDFEARLCGESYAEIAARGGGILSTVAATREASDATLRDLAALRVEQTLVHGVTTIEVKSGYGLDTKNELRLLETVLYCDRHGLPDLVPTFLGAHTLPAEARESEAARDRYVSLVVDEMLPQVARRRLARFCDVFIEEGAFRLDEGRKVLERAKGLGLGLKVHADQLTHTGGASLAAELGAVSVEHIEHASDADLAALAAAGTVAVLLPGASFFLRDEPVDAGRLRKAGVYMAVATDQNPGSSPTDNLLLMAQMGVLASGMTIEEALLGITTHAARSLGMERDRGRVAPGMRADLALFRCEDPRELLYRFGAPLCSGVIKDGRYQRVEAGRMGGLRQHQ